MSHCEWCHYDGAPHSKCDAKIQRRQTIDSMILPVLSEMGVNAYEDNLKHKIAMLIEAQMDGDDDVAISVARRERGEAFDAKGRKVSVSIPE